MTQDQIKQDHLTMIGASEVGTILGYNKWSSPHALFMQKLGMTQQTDNDAMAAGRDLEEWIVTKRLIPRLDRETKKHWIVIKPPLVRHADYPFLGCHIDGFLSASESIATCAYFDPTHEQSGEWELFDQGIEIKNIGQASFDQGWGEEGTDQIPDSYMAQCQFSMWVLRSQAKALGITEPINSWLVGVFIGGRSFKLYQINYNEQLVQSWLPHLIDFWNRLQAKEPPDIDASPACTTLLNIRAHDEENDKVAAVTIAMDKAVTVYLHSRGKIAEYEELADKQKNIIINELRGGALADGPDWKVSWKKSAPRKTIDWKGIAKELPIPEPIITKHTTLKEIERTFRCTFKREE